MENKEDITTLARFISSRREKIGLTQGALAKKCNLETRLIEDIEQGIELFLPSTVRQKLARGLKVSLGEIKKYESKVDLIKQDNTKIEDIIRGEILEGIQDIKCPVCNEKLITKIEKMYDLEDNLVLHAKARCTKCPFQIR